MNKNLIMWAIVIIVGIAVVITSVAIANGNKTWRLIGSFTILFCIAAMAYVGQYMA